MMVDEYSCWHDGATRRRAGHRVPPLVSIGSVASLRAPPSKRPRLGTARLHVRASLLVGWALPKRGREMHNHNYFTRYSTISTVVMFCRGRDKERAGTRSTSFLSDPAAQIRGIVPVPFSCAAPPRRSSVVG